MVSFDFIRVVLDRSPPQRPSTSGSGGTTIKRIKICTPTAGPPVAPDFTAEGTVSLPDTSCVACVVGAHPATNINNAFNKWSADFNNTPVGPGTLTATGDMGSNDTIPIEVAAHPVPEPV